MNQHGADCNSVFDFMPATDRKPTKMNRRRFLRHTSWATPLLALADAFAVEPEWVKVRTVRASSGKSTHRLVRSEEHTSELQSRLHLVCRLLLEKKKKQQ